MLREEKIFQKLTKKSSQRIALTAQGVRTERYKYFEHDPVIEELYDLKTDPHEQNNLIANPEYAEVLVKLRKKTEELKAEAQQPEQK